MEVKIDYLEERINLSVTGRLDTVNAPIFEKKISPILASDMKDVIMDCKDLEYISSSGLRLFLVMQKHANAKKGELTIINMNAEIKSVFDMTGFTALFNIK